MWITAELARIVLADKIYTQSSAAINKVTTSGKYGLR